MLSYLQVICNAQIFAHSYFVIELLKRRRFVAKDYWGSAGRPHVKPSEMERLL